MPGSPGRGRRGCSSPGWARTGSGSGRTGGTARGRSADLENETDVLFLRSFLKAKCSMSQAFMVVSYYFTPINIKCIDQ